jgi:hypothetical protein
MKKLHAAVLALALVLVAFAPRAHAFDRCCWDWDTVNPGANDNPPFDPKTDPDPVWAQCVPAQNPACFERENRQEIWFDWYCEVGTNSPDGTVPDPGHGFYCRNKSAPTDLVATGNLDQPSGTTSPPGQFPTSGVTYEAVPTPGVSMTGLALLALGMILAAGYFLRRKRGTAIANL